MKLGVVGSSAGNGHPYSWSAILNGYDQRLMASCPYPAIPAYLAAHHQELRKLRARVTHIWCENQEEAQAIAAAALIPYVCSSIEEMISNVDGVLHARDDYEQHLGFARQYTAANKPVFIDKPVANTLQRASEIFLLDPQEDLVFTCTGLRFDPLIADLTGKPLKPGDAVKAVGPKDWSRYSIHLIEPGLRLVRPVGPLVEWSVGSEGRARRARFKWANSATLHIETTGRPDTPFTFSLNDEEMILRDPFHAFRNTLEAFIQFCETRKTLISRSETLQVVDLIERGAQ